MVPRRQAARWIIPLIALCVSAQEPAGEDIGLKILPERGRVVAQKRAPFLLNCSVQAAPEFFPLNYTWLKNGVPLAYDQRIRLLPNGSLAFKRILHKKNRRLRTDSGWYDCYVQNKIGAVFAHRIRLSVAENKKNGNILPKSQKQPVGGVARFRCHIDGVPEPIYFHNEVQLKGGPRYRTFGGVLQIVDLRPSDEGSYHCMTGGETLKHSGQAQLQITKELRRSARIVAGPANTTAVKHDKSVVLECLADGYPRPKVNWTRQDNRPIREGAVVTDGNLEFREVLTNDEGVYICTAVNSLGRDSRSAHLIVNYPPVISTVPKTKNTQYAMDMPFECDATGKPPPTLTWFKDGKELQNNLHLFIDFNGKLMVNEAELEDSGYFQCVVNNSVDYATIVFRSIVFKSTDSPQSSPHNVKVTVLSESRVNVSWEDPLGSPRRPESSIWPRYLIASIIEDPMPNPQQHYDRHHNLDGVNYFYVVDNLQPNTRYSFYVRQFNSKGAGPRSNMVSVRTLESVPVKAPTIVSLKTNRPRSIYVEWLPLTPQEACGTITEYIIYYKDTSQKPFQEASVNGDKNSFLLTGLEPDTEYSIQVLGRTARGFPNLNVIQWRSERARTRSGTEKTFDLEVSLVNSTAVTLSWLLPQRDSVRSFSLTLEKTSSSEQLGPFQLPPSANSYTVTNLENNTGYDITMEARRGGDQSWWASGKVVPKSPLDRPPPPPDVRGQGLSASEIRLEWERPVTPLDIVSYTVNYTARIDLKTNFSASQAVSSNAPNTIIAGLRPFTEYRVTVRSHTMTATGEYSKPSIFRTLEDAPAPPENVKAVVLTPTKINVSWKPPVACNGEIVSYEVYLSATREGGDQWTVVRKNATTTSADVPDLLEGEYMIKVRARTRDHKGNFSSLIFVQKAAVSRPDNNNDPTAAPGTQGNDSSEKLVLIVCLVIAIVVILICVVVVALRYRCFGCCGQPSSLVTQPVTVTTGNGDLNHHPGNHANGHAVVPQDVEMETYVNMLTQLPENSSLDAKGGGSLVLSPGGYRNGFTQPIHNGHVHGNGHLAEEEKVRQPLLSEFTDNGSPGNNGEVTPAVKCLGDSLDGIDREAEECELGQDDMDDSSTPLVVTASTPQKRELASREAADPPELIEPAGIGTTSSSTWDSGGLPPLSAASAPSVCREESNTTSGNSASDRPNIPLISAASHQQQQQQSSGSSGSVDTSPLTLPQSSSSHRPSDLKHHTPCCHDDGRPAAMSSDRLPSEPSHLTSPAAAPQHRSSDRSSNHDAHRVTTSVQDQSTGHQVALDESDHSQTRPDDTSDA